MKTLIYSLIITSMFFSAYNVSAKETEPELIEKYESDVTGDGNFETINLHGVLLSADSPYYKDIYAIITSDHQEWRIDYQGGYDPSLDFVDLNHDGIDDIFFQSATGGSGGLYQSRLDILINGKVDNISLPEQHYIKGSFADGFNAVIEIAPNKQPIVMDVESRKNDYISKGIYDEMGNILKQSELIVDPIAFYKPVLISKKNGYGLKSYKQISGAYHADRLGVMETLWYYENDKWIVLQTEWVTSN